MSASGVSDELPLYLKSKFTVLNPPKPQPKPLKAVKPILRQGVSSESPVFFQLNHVAVIDSAIRNREISGKNAPSDRFLSSLKQNTVSLRPMFDFDESQYRDFDYHSLKPSKIIDLAADKSPRIKDQTKFRQEFRNHFEKGFGRPRGQCTLEAMQPNVPRYQQGHIEVLKKKLNLSTKQTLHFKLNNGRTILNQTQLSFPSSSQPLHTKSKLTQRRTSTPASISEIDEFERKQLGNSSPLENRRIYQLD